MHKHFSMETDQRLTDIRNISISWTVNNSDIVVPKYGGFISPRTSRFNGLLSLVRFDFSPCSSDGDPNCELFIRILALLH